MQKSNKSLPLSAVVALAAACAAGCAPQSPPPPPTPITTGTGPARAVVIDKPAGSPIKVNESKPAGPPAEEAALAEVSTADLIGKLGSDADRQAAARVLAGRGGPEVVEALSAALTHDQWQVRAGAAFTLSQMGQSAQPAKSALEKAAASDADQTVRDAAAFALDAIAQP
jgi:hypothetical protein